MGSLAGAKIGERVRITSAKLDHDVSAWLAAVGLAEGEEVVVLRRAALGGPLHVRLATGGEFAVAMEIAKKLEVAPPREPSSKADDS
jgi:ferrous iron transport protein A